MFKALGQWFRQSFGLSKHDKPTIALSDQTPSDSQMAEQFDSIDAASHLVPYDENLLERARTQWQFGDWQSLANLDRDTLQHHPERAKLVLLAAAGRLQIGQASEARQYIRLAQDWGCSKKHISQVLISGVHNSIGMAAAIGANHQRAALHFEKAIRVGSPSSDIQLLTQARTVHQVSNYDPISLLMPTFSGHPTKPQKIINPGIVEISENIESASESENQRPDLSQQAPNSLTSLFQASLTMGSEALTQLSFNSKSKGICKNKQGLVKFDLPGNTPAYLVSNEAGDFEIAPNLNSVPLEPNKAYELSGTVIYEGSISPLVWLFEYDESRQKINSRSYPTKNGEFRTIFKTQVKAASWAMGIRLGGSGSLNPHNTWFNFENSLAIEVAEAMQHNSADFDKKLAELQTKLQKDQQNQSKNSLRQIESFLRLQNYCGDRLVLPDMHGWPVSPDLGVYIIRLVEAGGFDAIVEFGSGVSTLLIALALQKAADPHAIGVSTPFVSFEHLESYLQQTQAQLDQAQLSESVELVYAPLIETAGALNNPSLYYDCQSTLQQLKQSIDKPNPKLLVFVDGPPAATGPLARFPAMPSIEQAFGGSAEVHYLMDDYIRQDERNIVDQWQTHLEQLGRQVEKQELKQFEKQACLCITKAQS
jgi:hypothetical protein